MLINWLPYAIICAFFLATADSFVKLAADKISASVGMLIYGITTFTVSLAWVLYQKFAGQPQLITRPGLWYSLGVGLAFSGVTLLLYVTFARVEVSIGSPTIRILGIVLASAFGILLLKEPFTWRYALGALLTLLGVGLIVMR